jgi:hypothetical protein
MEWSPFACRLTFVRRVTPRDKIPPEARPLIDRFAEQRLLTKDRRQNADAIEVAAGRAATRMSQIPLAFVPIRSNGRDVLMGA